MLTKVFKFMLPLVDQAVALVEAHTLRRAFVSSWRFYLSMRFYAQATYELNSVHLFDLPRNSYDEKQFIRSSDEIVVKNWEKSIVQPTPVVDAGETIAPRPL